MKQEANADSKDKREEKMIREDAQGPLRLVSSTKDVLSCDSLELYSDEVVDAVVFGEKEDVGIDEEVEVEEIVSEVAPVAQVSMYLPKSCMDVAPDAIADKKEL